MSAPVARPAGSAELAGERAVRRFVTVLAVTVGGLCFLFSAGNVYQLAVDLGLWAWIRPLVAPAVDLTVVALVVGIRFLARRGLSGAELRRPRLFMLAVGLAAWALNTAGAVAQRNWGKAAFDSLAPGLLIGWAEVLPWFLRQFHAVTHPAAEAGAVPVPVPAASEDQPAGTVPMPAAAKATASPAPSPCPLLRTAPLGRDGPVRAAPRGLVPPRPGRARRPRPSWPSAPGRSPRRSPPSTAGRSPATRCAMPCASATAWPASCCAPSAKPRRRPQVRRPARSRRPTASRPGRRPRPPRVLPPRPPWPVLRPRTGTVPRLAARPCPSRRPRPAALPRSHKEAVAMSRIAYVVVVTVAILVLVGKDNTHALSAQAVVLFGEAGRVLLAKLKKYL